MTVRMTILVSLSVVTVTQQDSDYVGGVYRPTEALQLASPMSSANNRSLLVGSRPTFVNKSVGLQCAAKGTCNFFAVF